MRILVVEDEPLLASALIEALEDDCYAVDLAGNGATADELMRVNSYDAVVLDWTIPPPTGLELLELWREAGIEIPVLMLTGKSEIEDRVSGLDSGADDYLTKPFAISELLARVRTLLRRRHRPLTTDLEVADVKIDRARRRVTVAGREVELPPKEFAMLEYLMARPGEVVSRADLVEHVWDDCFDSFSNVVDVIVYRLRKKIDGGRRGRLLDTVKGVGYVLRETRR